MKTTVDWLTFRTQSDPFETLESMRSMFGTAGDLLTLKTGVKGIDGWLRGGELSMAGDIALGRIDYDGESQRGWVRVQLWGEGCGWVQDWQAAAQLEHRLKGAEIKRLDLALTTYAGEVTHEMVVDAHARREFSSGGRQPHYHPIGGGSDPRAGRTIYIGKRSGSDKFLRCYEKGWQMVTKAPESIRDTVTHINGHRVDQMYRVEVEFKAETKRIGWDAIEARDAVFAGAYPFCASLLPGCSEVKLEKLPDLAPVLTLAAKLDSCRRAYGEILRAGSLAYGGGEAGEKKVLELVMAASPSRALIEAGVLTCTHA